MKSLKLKQIKLIWYNQCVYLQCLVILTNVINMEASTRGRPPIPASVINVNDQATRILNSKEDAFGDEVVDLSIVDRKARSKLK